MYVCTNMDSINEITAKTEVPLEPSPEVKAKVAAKKENKRKLAEVYIHFIHTQSGLISTTVNVSVLVVLKFSQA